MTNIPTIFRCSRHNLKTWPLYFQAIADGRKTFDVRKNDRGFKEGDILELMEYNPETKKYTGRILLKRIGFMIEGEWGLSAETCCMSLLPFEQEGG